MALRLGGCGLTLSRSPTLSASAGKTEGARSFNRHRFPDGLTVRTSSVGSRVPGGFQNRRSRNYTVVLAATHEASSDEEKEVASLSRQSFPDGFIFGSATSSYQVEGATKEDGRGPSIWDTFVKNYPEKIADRSNGDVAIDSYHRYKEDVAVMKDLNMDAYRFSISWPRILPNGHLSGGINEAGVQYYNNLIDELISKGIEPFVTLFHWDLPQGLEEQYTGFLSPRIVDDFRDYAELCFKLFGDRVKHWITFNEPWTFCKNGYSTGLSAPGRCSAYEAGHCKVGNSGVEVYLAAHHQLLSHAAAAKLYREKYKASQKGEIGITLVSNWSLPYEDNSKSAQDAAGRALDFMLGWFMDPLTDGDYPFNMRAIVGDRLPCFTDKQSKMVKGSLDFLGLNYYTTYYADSISLFSKEDISYDNDIHASQGGIRNGVPIGPQAASGWLFVYPPGIRDLLLYIKEKYNNPNIYITENGVGYPDDPKLTLEEVLKDDSRTDYYQKHLLYVRNAIREGVPVKGYFAWSLFDNFEWVDGYTTRFGINYVDYNTLKRYPKNSALWFRKFLKK